MPKSTSPAEAAQMNEMLTHVHVHVHVQPYAKAQYIHVNKILFHYKNKVREGGFLASQDKYTHGSAVR